MQEEIREQDIGTPKDYAQQILLSFKNLEEGVSDFQGHKVMEDSEEEMMYHLIEEAINQALQAQRENILGEIKQIESDLQGHQAYTAVERIINLINSK